MYHPGYTSWLCTTLGILLITVNTRVYLS